MSLASPTVDGGGGGGVGVVRHSVASLSTSSEQPGRLPLVQLSPPEEPAPRPLQPLPGPVMGTLLGETEKQAEQRPDPQRPCAQAQVDMAPFSGFCGCL